MYLQLTFWWMWDDWNSFTEPSLLEHFNYFDEGLLLKIFLSQNLSRIELLAKDIQKRIKRAIEWCIYN